MIRHLSFLSIILFALSFNLTLLAQNSVDFDTYFHDETMRVDYEHLGDATMELIVPDRNYRYGFWAGNKNNLIDTFGYGLYNFVIVDETSGELLYSKDYDSNFGEYEVTPYAKAGVKKSFHESALFPVPKKEFKFLVQKRIYRDSFEILYERLIDPDGVGVIKESTGDPFVLVLTGMYNGDSHNKIDVVFVAEGYESAEINKFETDLKRFSESLFEKEPLKANKNKFNVWGVFKASPESGVDQPRHKSFKKTNVGASFNSFGIERYLLINDNKSLRDIAGHAPYDAIFILVNHERYGGAGMYNLYCTMTSDNSYSDFLMIHEFGHSFFGLADEYYTSEVGFDELHGTEYEPASANITALHNPKQLKWKHLVKEDTPLPTPWGKEAYDAADKAWQQERSTLKEGIATLVRAGAPADEIERAKANYREKDAAHAKKMYDWLHTGPFAGKVGAFEGAGYVSEGMYRPTMDCIMYSKRADDFCPVCREAMQNIIDWHTFSP